MPLPPTKGTSAAPGESTPYNLYKLVAGRVNCKPLVAPLTPGKALTWACVHYIVPAV